MRCAPLVIVAVFALTGCGGDQDPDNRPGANGAFGGADDCGELVDEAVAAYERVLTQLGDARRTDTERVDAALQSFGGEGPDLAVRYDGLGCGGDFDRAVCTATADLRAGGPAARDVLTTLQEGCRAP
jgi:hypothetical protein